jgi:hypothetical protein
MQAKRLWWNEEILPSKEEPQRLLFLCYPTIKKWYVDFTFHVGYAKDSDDEHEGIRIDLILFGFGIMYCANWDI